MFFLMVACEGPMGPQGIQGDAGGAGNDGISILWIGELASHPETPQRNWAYYNTIDKIAYIYDGSTWQILAKDGILEGGKFEGIWQTPLIHFGLYFTIM